MADESKKTPDNPAEAKAEFGQVVAAMKDALAKDGPIYGAQALAQKAADTSAETKEELARITARLDDFEFDSKTRGPAKIEDAVLNSKQVEEFSDYLLDFVLGDETALQGKSYTPTKMDMARAEKQRRRSKKRESKDTDTHVRYVLESAGALLMPPQLEREIIKNVVEYTPIMRLARVTQLNSAILKRRARLSTPGLVFLSENIGTDEDKKLRYGLIEIPAKDVGAGYSISLQLEEDMDYDFVTEMVEAYREDFDVTIGSEALRGDGTRLMSGIVGNVTNFNSGGTSLTSDMLIYMQETLKEAYHRNASWLFTRQVRGYIRALVLSATNGLQYTWEPDFKAQAPTRLLGNPVEIANIGDADLPTLDSRTSGAFEVGQVPILYGDFRQGYEIAWRRDMRLIDDPYTQAKQMVRNFFIFSRIGGKVIKSEALVQMTITNS